MKKRNRLLASAVLTSLLFSTACGGGGTTNEAAPGKGSEPAAKKEPIELTFYRPNTGTTEEQFMQLFGNKIKEKFPHITPKFITYGTGTSVNEVMASGQPLDIIIYSIGFIQQYHKLNLYAELDEYIKKQNYDLNKLEKTNYDFIKQNGNGKIYSLPLFTTAETLMYNKDLFDKFGVPYPKEGMTWDELYDLAKKMSRNEGGVQYYGFLTSISHMLNVNQLSLPFVDGKTNQPAFNNEQFIKMTENFTRFYNIPGAVLPKEKYGKEADLFNKDRTLAMYAHFNSVMVGSQPDQNLDAVPLPSFKEAPGVGSQMYPTFGSVTSTSKYKEAAFEVLAFLTSEEMQTKYAKEGLGMPIINNSKIIDTFGSDIPVLKGKNIKAFYPTKPAPISAKTLFDDIGSKHAGNAFREVAQGVSDSNTAFRKAYEAAVKEIEAAAQK
ncbi:ABC transporter substrate-binding protein [Paenibacillus sp. NPDC056579]|uniref:ABC transporter substrate-binding protein n=1 Tax=Paenibacillus sp. NPDC056579 TaxID=3345871 RepID=UPI0036A16289